MKTYFYNPRFKKANLNYFSYSCLEYEIYGLNLLKIDLYVEYVWISAAKTVGKLIFPFRFLPSRGI